MSHGTLLSRLGLSRPEVRAWAMYDWANSPFQSTVINAVFPLFFASYVTYHHYFGSTRFTGVGAIRPVYFFILLTHVVLAVVVVPLILLSFFTSLSGRLLVHRRVSKFTFPIWLYVSVTGVLVFAMLKLFSA